MLVLGGPIQERLSRPLRIVRLVGLAVLVMTIVRVDPQPGPHGRNLAATLALSLATTGWLMWLASARLPERAASSAWFVIGVPGAALAGLSPHSAAVAFPAVALIDAGARLPHRTTLVLGAAVLAAVGAGHIAGSSWANVTPQLLLLTACTLLGTLRRQYVQRAEQSELLLSKAQYAAQEHARAATLAERSRIAREIHDIQAHSLAALSVQLKVIDALLEQASEPERIRHFVSRAEQLANEGLVETRRAILALRDEGLPLEHLVKELVSAYGEQDGARATFSTTGPPVALPADTTMAMYRTAQEALTNVRKHAPDSPIDVELAYEGTGVALTVTNGAPVGRQTGDALPGSGTGYGLAGLRERANLADGTLNAGPHETGWRVRIRIPL